jgi:hypothetical protein
LHENAVNGIFRKTDEIRQNFYDRLCRVSDNYKQQKNLKKLDDLNKYYGGKDPFD